ncbi:MAG: hypothetical protein EXS31_17565 [Pedosphaera sp.]|nr:hypothetical protein [Pedosphaera sp.]
MLRCFYILTALLFATTSFSAQKVAQARLTCLSLRFSPATANTLGQSYLLEIGTVPSAGELNGELAPTFDDRIPSHGTSFRLTSAVFPEPLTGDLVMDVAGDADTDLDGYSDFFEVDKPIAATVTPGFFRTALDKGSVSASWSREAGSSKGTCKLKLKSDTFGELPTLQATFELLNYQGPLTYTTDTGQIEGSINLERSGDVKDILAGKVTFLRSVTNRFEDLKLVGGSWTNSEQKTLSLFDTLVSRDSTLRTNYFTIVEFQDGDLRTADDDFYNWQLSIDDLNDADHDGIPDFSDDPAPQPVTLKIVPSGDRVRIEVSGQAGRAFDLEETSSLVAPVKWTFVSGVILLQNVQTIEAPVVGRETAYWRLKER